ncbi:predicted protein [Botrytis cinerea T4]|uniref:Uncharacterized protein n=1 Tax=Botryotinia fuckeliana (strain T4) TaxID=999810 RepID=G2YJ03_BOTF4|nr:predicted protein [Botrytis cinerea T4]
MYKPSEVKSRRIKRATKIQLSASEERRVNQVKRIPLTSLPRRISRRAYATSSRDKRHRDKNPRRRPQNPARKSPPKRAKNANVDTTPNP